MEVIGFFGGDTQVGTTMLAWSFAESIAKGKMRVLLVFGSGNNDEGLLRGICSSSLEDLKASIRSGQIEQEEVMNVLEKKKKLWILGGVKNPLTASHFPENTFQLLLEKIQDRFDIVVIDGGSDVQMGLTISALNICERRYFVLTQQSKTIHRYMKWKQQIYNPLKLQGRVVVNKYIKDPALLLKKDIQHLLDEEEIVMIPYVECGFQAELEGKCLYSFPPFGKAIDHLANQMIPSEKKEYIWKKIFG